MIKMYNKNLILKKKLVRYWILWGGKTDSIGVNNYYFYLLCEKVGGFGFLKKLIIVLRRIAIFFFSLLKKKRITLALIIGSLYSKSICFKKYSYIKKIQKCHPSIFTNFFKQGIQEIDTLTDNKKVRVIIFLESLAAYNMSKAIKVKNTLTIGLVSGETNIEILDYSVPVNSLYFYTVCLFSKILFRILSLRQKNFKGITYKIRKSGT